MAPTVCTCSPDIPLCPACVAYAAMTRRRATLDHETAVPPAQKPPPSNGTMTRQAIVVALDRAITRRDALSLRYSTAQAEVRRWRKRLTRLDQPHGRARVEVQP